MNKINKEIEKKLFELQDTQYRDFQSKLIPSDVPFEMIGVRTSKLRGLAKSLYKREDIEQFLTDLPHKYFDENQLHAFIISELKDFEKCISAVEAFLPYVNNWATCDQLTPKVFKKHKFELLKYIDEWMKSARTYTVRFAVKMLMTHFLDEDFELKYAQSVAEIRSEEYYIKMMIAWYFATALAKQYDSIIPFIENKKLDVWTHNKAIQKSVESYRITAEQRDYLKTLRIKK